MITDELDAPEARLRDRETREDKAAEAIRALRDELAAADRVPVTPDREALKSMRVVVQAVLDDPLTQGADNATRAAQVVLALLALGVFVPAIHIRREEES